MSTSSSGRGQLATPTTLRRTMPAVVQVVALHRGFFGGTSAAWTGSGTIVDPRGIVLTNCHVASPRSMGMPSPPAQQLGLAMTGRSDEPPALTYIGEIVALAPELDLAVLKIVTDARGNRVRDLDLPCVAPGDSDTLELADNMAIFGYPGIGGDTITFTSGSVAGFTRQGNVKARRAWIKTDATIAGGNSGGTAINHDGELIGIPTQAAAGEGITPVDARPVVDTNRDGRVDHRDTPMAIGGFINGLRPVNLAKPLLREAGVKVTGRGARTQIPVQKPRTPRLPARPKVPEFGNLVFSSRVSHDGRPINPTDILPSGVTRIHVTFDYDRMNPGQKWGQIWAHNGKPILNAEENWDSGESGQHTLVISNNRELPDGEYKVVLTLDGEISTEGAVSIGRRVNDTDTQISGQVVDEADGRAIAGALVIALKPGIRIADFIRMQSQKMAYTSTKTNRTGQFTLPKQLFKGQSYGLVVVARGYEDLAVESALRVSSMAPEEAQIPPIAMRREG